MIQLEPEVRRFLGRSMNARIATLSKGGRPQIMPLFFVLRDGEILMNNAETSPTVRNIAHNPEVELLFLADTSPRDRRCLRIRGTADFTQDPAALSAIARPMALKYYGNLHAIISTLRNLRRLSPMVRYRRERRGGVIRVRPESSEFLDLP